MRATLSSDGCWFSRWLCSTGGAVIPWRLFLEVHPGFNASSEGSPWETAPSWFLLLLLLLLLLLVCFFVSLFDLPGL